MTLTLEDAIALVEASARWEGMHGSKRRPRSTDLLPLLQELAEFRHERARKKAMAKLPGEREALQKLICADDTFGCPELRALIASGWAVETRLDDIGITIVAQRTNKE